MHFGFILDSWKIDLWDIDLLDTDVDLLVGYGQIQIFPVSISFSCETSSRHLQSNNFLSSKMSSGHLQDVLQDVIKASSRLLQDVFARRLQDVLKMSWKTYNCYAEDKLKMFSRHDLKTSSRRLEEGQIFAGL